MSPAPTRDRDPAAVAGFAVGIGVAFLATVGTTLNFVYPEAAPALLYPLVFLGGGAVGAAWAAVRGVAP